MLSFLSLIYALVFFFVVGPIAVMLGPPLLRFWQWLPQFVRYLLFIPVAFFIAALLTVPISILLLRDFLFVPEANFWKTIVFPLVVRSVMTVVWSVFVVWLCPNYERIILKAILWFYAGVIVTLWGLSIWLAASTDFEFWGNSTISELMSSICVLCVIFALLKWFDSFHAALRGMIEDEQV